MNQLFIFLDGAVLEAAVWQTCVSFLLLLMHFIQSSKTDAEKKTELAVVII